MRPMRFQPHKRLLSAGIASVFLSLLCAAVAFGQPGSSSRAQSCLAAARKALGPQAEVLKCGDLTGNGAFETAAAIRINRLRATADGIPVSKLVVLRRVGGMWTSELAVDKESMRNGAGYIEYLRGYPGTSDGFRASFSENGSVDAEGVGFTVYLYFLSPTGEDEGTYVDISWNPAVERFQEFCYDCDQPAFRPEVKNPQPFHRRKGCGK